MHTLSTTAIETMRWLVRLVTPPGGTVLEPFAGSGTTVEACLLEGFRCIAIEREADYHRRQFAEFEAILERGTFATPSTPLALEWGLRYEAAISAWADWAAAQVAADDRRARRRRKTA